MNPELRHEGVEVPGEWPEPEDVSVDGGGQIVGTREKWQPDELRRERADRAEAKEKPEPRPH
jgi:hypothetical protein